MAGSEAVGRTGQTWVVAAAAAALAAVAAAAHFGAESAERGATLAAAVLLGAIGGLGLYHAAFGFTGAWRKLQRERRGAGVRAQILLLAIVVVVTYPLITSGATPPGWVFPMTLASAIGAAMFGFGMQLGGGCGSGTLFTVGGGSTRMGLTLGGFLAGSVIWSGTGRAFSDAVAGAWSSAGFEGAARLPATSLINTVGGVGALVLTLGALAALAFWAARVERRAHGDLAPVFGRSAGLRGPWSLAFGAVVLAGVVVACFALLGRPWGITAAYPLWGAKIADLLGFGVADWRMWRDGALERSIFADATSVMNFGVIFGALAAAGLAGRFAPTARIGLRDAATAIIGGLLMGYGARLAFGCNIGGLVGGVASASLHGWWWLAFGALGSVLGVFARGRLGMDPPAPFPLLGPARGAATPA